MAAGHGPTRRGTALRRSAAAVVASAAHPTACLSTQSSGLLAPVSCQQAPPSLLGRGRVIGRLDTYCVGVAAGVGTGVPMETLRSSKAETVMTLWPVSAKRTLTWSPGC